MLRGILNKSLKERPMKQQVYGHLPPISKDKTRNEKHLSRLRSELASLLPFPTTITVTLSAPLDSKYKY